MKSLIVRLDRQKKRPPGWGRNGKQEQKHTNSPNPGTKPGTLSFDDACNCQNRLRLRGFKIHNNISGAGFTYGCSLRFDVDEERLLVLGALALVGSVPVVVFLQPAPPLAGLLGAQILEPHAALMNSDLGV